MKYDVKQIVTGHPLMVDEDSGVQGFMEQISDIIRENEELRAKIEGYEKYIAMLEGQIKIAENIILHYNANLDSFE